MEDRLKAMRARLSAAAALVCLALTPLSAGPGGDVKPRPAPALPASEWLNTPANQPLRLEELRGKVVLVEFWTFACYNCRNALPYVKAWHQKYAVQGLVVVGVHSPEFSFERPREKVKRAVAELGIAFPVALDNDFATWKRYKNEYWPAFYLIDAEGRIVYTAIGEGDYDRTERKIQQLLVEAQARLAPARNAEKASSPPR